jgi:hypothetical protein
MWDMRVGRGTIANILREYGIDPAPERDKRMPWSTFLRAHRGCLVATEFLTIEVCFSSLDLPRPVGTGTTIFF